MASVFNQSPITEGDVNFLLYYYLEPSQDDSDATLAAKQFIKSLPERDRVAYVLSLDGQTYRSIGAYMGRPFTSVARWVNSVKVKLADHCRSFECDY